MEKDKKNSVKISNRIKNLMGNLQNNIDKIYQLTHMTSSINKKDMEIIKTNMDGVIDNIRNDTYKNTGSMSLSSIANRSESSDSLMQDIQDLFGDRQITENLMGILDDNKAMQAYDNEVDIVLKYFTLLEEALDSKKDCTLCADTNNKDYLNFTTTSETPEFAENMKKLKKKYKMLEETDHIYDECSHHGEAFYILCSYNRAFSELLKKRQEIGAIGFANEAMYSASDTTDNNGYIIEADISFDANSWNAKVNGNSVIKSNIFNEDGDIKKIDENYSNFKITLNTSGILESVNSEMDKIISIKNRNKDLVNTFTASNVKSSISKKKDLFLSPDALTDDSNTEDDADKINVSGAVWKELKRQNVKPIIINNVCLGYYYIECDFDQYVANRRTNMFIANGKRSALTSQDEMQRQNQERMMFRISEKISQFIDSSFINAHQDIKDYIYSILKYNNEHGKKKLTNINVTYLPPEIVKHYYFKLDKDTHRGISDLEKAMVPAKIWVCLTLNTALGILTRSYDKRVYYVKQSVDKNIATSVQNVLNQIKKGNYGSREISSMKNILNISGRYVDFVIPMTSGGDYPINMEVLNGQQIQTNDEFVEKVAQAAIEATDMPYEWVQGMNNSDYALRLTMSNGKVLRKVFNRQTIIEDFMGETASDLYFYEYGVRIPIELILPPPVYLSISNMSNLMDNILRVVEQIVAMNTDESREDAQEYSRILKKKLMRYYLSSYLDINQIDKLVQETENDLAVKKPLENQEQ